MTCKLYSFTSVLAMKLVPSVTIRPDSICQSQSGRLIGTGLLFVVFWSSFLYGDSISEHPESVAVVDEIPFSRIGEGFMENLTRPFSRWLDESTDQLIEFEEAMIIRKGDEDSVLRTTNGLLAISKKGDIVFTRYWDKDADIARKRQSVVSRVRTESNGKERMSRVTTSRESSKNRLISIISKEKQCFYREIGQGSWSRCLASKAIRETHYYDYRKLPVSLANSLVIYSGQGVTEKSIFDRPVSKVLLYENGDVQLFWQDAKSVIKSSVLFSADSRMMPVLTKVALKNRKTASNQDELWSEFGRTQTAWSFESEIPVLQNVVLRYRTPRAKAGKGLVIQGNVFFNQDQTEATDSMFEPIDSNFPIPLSKHSENLSRGDE